MKTICVQIGNSDDKLSQLAWSNFVNETSDIIAEHCQNVYFSGGSVHYMPWQNAAFVFDCDDKSITVLKEKLTQLRARFKQDSIAWLEGETQFI